MKALFLFVLLIISAKNFSQIRLGSVYVRSEKTVFDDETSQKSTYVKGFINNIPAAVISNFSLRYPDAENISWFINDKEVSGYFRSKDEQVAIAYKKDGLFLYERKNYDGSKLNVVAKDFLERETGFSVAAKQVTHITRENEEIYEVSIEDEKRWHIYRFGRKKDGNFLMMEKTSFIKGEL